MSPERARRLLTRIARQMGHPDAAALRGRTRGRLISRQRRVALEALLLLGAAPAEAAAALARTEAAIAGWRLLDGRDRKSARLLATHLNGGHAPPAAGQASIAPPEPH